jgi:hypothetical protein
LLTYGSPLDKFAAIWPARVPINKKDEGLSEHNGDKTEWINVYDPTDPVAAQLDAFARPQDAISKILLEPTNFAYAAHSVLLLSHLHYLDGKEGRTDRLADHLMRWVLGGKAFVPGAIESRSPWLRVNSWRRRCRSIFAFATWIFAYLFLTFLGALSLPLWKSLFVDGGGAVTEKIGKVWDNFFEPRATFHIEWLTNLAHAIADYIAAFYSIVLKPIWDGVVAFALWILSGFIAVFGPKGLLTEFAIFFGLPALVEEMIKLGLGVAIFVTAAGIIGWLFVFDRKPITPPAGPAAAAVRVAGWVKGLASRSNKKETAGASR